MTGTSLNEGAELLQIAAVGPLSSFAPPRPTKSQAQKVYQSTVGITESAYWDIEAESIHGITKEEALKGRNAALVDIEFTNWLIELGANQKRRLIVPVGFNVGSFDMKFIKSFLPKSFDLFTRRAVDLNGICFSIDGLKYLGETKSAEQWKELAIAYGRYRLSVEGDKGLADAHDAEFDAWVHAYAWEFLKESIRGRDLRIGYSEADTDSIQSVIASLRETLTLNEISLSTGIPSEFLRGWSRGGRARNKEWIELLNQLYLDRKN